MASSKEYLDFVLEQLSELDEITHKAMMEEYILYYRGKMVGGIYDDCFLVKPTKFAIVMMLDTSMALPYEGAGEMLLVDDIDKRNSLANYWRPCMKSYLRQRKRNRFVLSELSDFDQFSRNSDIHNGVSEHVEVFV